jgi:sec-independent protein translocase protein TatC
MTERDDSAATDDDASANDMGDSSSELAASRFGTELEEPKKEMPFLDHLEELRWRILKALGATLVGAIIAFTLSDQLLSILTHPYEDAVRSMIHEGNPGPVDAVTELVERWFDSAIADGTVATYEPDEPIPVARQLQGLKMMTYFFVNLQIALLGGLVLASPVVFYHFWRFVAPGLLTREVRVFLPVIGLSVICFLLGTMIAYWIVLPLGLRFFLGLEPPGLRLQPAVGDYINFALKLILGFGIVFEMPVVSLFLARMGLLTADYLRRIRRYAVVGVFLMAAIFTPPDPISQVMMALPLLVLYEISIWVAQISGKRQPAAEVPQ